MASIYTSLPYFRKPVAAVPLAPVLSKEDPEDIKVEPLKCSEFIFFSSPPSCLISPFLTEDLDKAADTALKAFADDPVARYIYHTPVSESIRSSCIQSDIFLIQDAKPPPKDGGHKGAKRVWWLIIAGQKKTKLALTVNGGESFIVA